MRTQSGTTSLRSILYIDEVFGYLPPVANPPSKTPLLTLLKQARAFGLGVVLATQNPVDLDYKAISNAGTWLIGRLQTERDKARVMDGLEGVFLSGQKQFDRKSMDQTLSALGNRIFLMNNVHEDQPAIFETRWALSYLRGPLTREQIKLIVQPQKYQPTVATPFQPPSVSTVTPAFPSFSIPETTSKPPLPPDIPEYYLQKTMDQSAGEATVYYPRIIGMAQVRFTNAKTGMDFTKEVAVLTPITNDPIPVNWDNSKQITLQAADLQKTGANNVSFAELPVAALRAKNYGTWKTEFANWLSKTQKIQLFKSSNFNEFSRVEESERDFRIRLQQVAREKRDQEVSALREKYTSKVAQIDDRIRRAQMDVQEHDAQVRDQKYQTAISLGTTILGGFLGRRALGGISKTSHDIGRSAKKKRESADAKENLFALQQEKSRLETQFQGEVNLLQVKTDPFSENLESIMITPAKTNIVVNLVALVWTSS